MEDSRLRPIPALTREHGTTLKPAEPPSQGKEDIQF